MRILILRGGFPHQQNNVVQLATCRARLDFGLLLLVGVVGNKVALEKKEIQTKTRLLCVAVLLVMSATRLMVSSSYRQNKFNLLREQSEGYTSTLR